MVGTQLGQYRILALLGRGGMGDVYLAEDTTLGRKVALKMLPAWLAARGIDRLNHEARALAALDHPNIVRVFSVEQADGVSFLTMQFVRGRTLADVQTPGDLALERFFAIAIPLVDAVAAAHQAGMIHRDLKPGNVMVGDNDHVTVLDFGLAKHIESPAEGLARLPTVTATADGQVKGTVAYMSPEQAEGKAIDTRSDVFSLGILLFEMLTGQRPFRGDTASAMLASILRDQPADVHTLNPRVPPELARLITRCLAKPLTKRLQSAVDRRNELEYLRDAGATNDAAAKPPAAARRRVAPGLLAAGGVALVTALAVVVWSWRPTPPTSSLWLLDNPRQLTTAAQAFRQPVWSPDGTRIAFESGQSESIEGRDEGDIWVMQAAGGTTLNLTENYPGGDRFPSWSPDGRQIAFVSTRDGGGVFVMPALGGAAHKLFPQPPDAASEAGISATGPPQWSADGDRVTVAFATLDDRTAVVSFSLATQQIEVRRLRARCYDMSWSPDGRFFACVEGNPTWDVRRVWLEPVGTGEAIPLPDTNHYNAQPFWSADGRTVFYTSRRGGSGELWRQSLDSAGRPAGAPVRVTTLLGALQAALSPRGERLAVSRGRPIANVWRVPILRDRRATWDDAQQITAERAETRHLDLSPDGHRLVVSSNRSGYWDLWSLIVGTGEWTQLTADETTDRGPQFSSDGTQIVFHAFRDGSHDLRVMPAAGGPSRALVEHPGTDWFGTWSPDDREIAFISDRAGSNDIWVVSSSGGEPRQITSDPAKDEFPLWSKDGQRLIFRSSRTAPWRLFQASSRGGDAEPLSAGAAGTATWHPSEDILFFHGAGDRGPNIWSLSLAGRQERPMTDLRGRAGNMVEFVLGTDGQHLYFVWTEDESDIWMMDVQQRPAETGAR